jgi:ribosomal 30S subunit maturation factor RimM
MEDIKQKRIEFLRNQFRILGKNQDKLELAANELNNALSRKRRVVIIKKWSELRSGLESELGPELWSELRSGLESELWSELRSELGFELWSELGFELWSELWSKLESELWSELRSELESELGSELRSELGSELGSGIFEYWENNWILFINEFYPHLKVLQKNKKKIGAIRKIVEAGNAYILISKEKLYILPFPEVRLNEKKQLHNLNGYALKFADKKTYWIEGVKFNKDLWQKVVDKKMSFKEIMKLENIEQRMVALKMMDAEKLLKESNAKLLDKSERGNELYLIENVFSQPAYFLKYKCPSTGRVYISGIDPNVAKKNPNADYCQSWKMGISIDEYLNNIIKET